MNFYHRYIFPKLVHWACGLNSHASQRRRLVPRARGVVLEIGIGSGLNLPFYDADRVTKVIGLDPATEITRLATAAAHSVPFTVEFIDLPGEKIPLADNSIDTILMTYTLCSIADTKNTLNQMQRVLKLGGRLLFCEHGAAPDLNIRRWQRRLNPIWHKISGGCLLDRNIPELIEAGGFKICDLEANYISGWRPASFNYLGAAAVRNFDTAETDKDDRVHPLNTHKSCFD